MTSKGQITVPKAVRDDLGLVTGSQVAFTRTPDGDYLLRRESQSIRSLRGSLRYDGPPVTFEAMNEAIVEASR